MNNASKCIAIVGSRDWTDYWLIHKCILRMRELYGDITIVSGGARGADSMGETIARGLTIPVRIFPAEWDIFGKSAGYKRNASIVNASDIVLAFFAPGPKSKGTSHTVSLATAHKETHVYHEGHWTSFKPLDNPTLFGGDRS